LNFSQTTVLPNQGPTPLRAKQTVTIITDAHVDDHEFDIRLKK